MSAGRTMTAWSPPTPDDPKASGDEVAELAPAAARTATTGRDIELLTATMFEPLKNLARPAYGQTRVPECRPNAKEMTSFGWGGDSRIVVT